MTLFIGSGIGVPDRESKVAPLPKEKWLYPAHLFRAAPREFASKSWWCFYTLARREKMLLRRLIDERVCCYSPMIRQQRRSVKGRISVSFVPLFRGYVFLLGDEMERYRAVSTGYVARWMPVPDPQQLVRDLAGIERLINAGATITHVKCLTPGTRVRVVSGPFAGLEGEFVRHKHETRLIIALNFLQQGAAVELDEGDILPSWNVPTNEEQDNLFDCRQTEERRREERSPEFQHVGR